MKYILVMLLILTSWLSAEKIDGPSQIVTEDVGFNYQGAVPTQSITTPEINDLYNKMNDAISRGDITLARQYDRQISEIRYNILKSQSPETQEPMEVHSVLPDPNGQSVLPLYWGTDRLVYPGQFRSFACDYDTNGTMYVAVSTPDSLIRLYRSTNHGLTWTHYQSWYHTTKDYYTKVGLVVATGDSGFIHVFVRHRNNNGDVYLIRVSKTSPTSYISATVSTGADTVNDFSVCEDYYNDYYLYILTSNERLSGGATGKFLRSLTYGRTWVDPVTWGNGIQPSISFVSQYTIIIANKNPTVSGRIFFERNTYWAHPDSWKPTVNVNADTFNAWGPCVTATNTRPDTNTTVWVLYTHNYQNSGDYDADYAYSTNGGRTFTTGHHLSWSGDNEDFVNIRHYRIYPNSYVNACYTEYYTTLTRDIYWHWTSGADPTGWSAEELVNDAPVSTSLGGKIIYSPHSPGSGGGAVYPRFGPDSLFFDANWLGIEELPPVNQNNNIIAVYPNPFANNITIGYQIANPTKVTLVVYDISGREVKSLINENANKGYYKITWNGRDNEDRFVTNGVYFLRVKTDKENRITKLILTK